MPAFSTFYSCGRTPGVTRCLLRLLASNRDIFSAIPTLAMVSVEVRREDLMALRVEVKSLPGTLFAGASPLLKPFMKKLEELLPPEKAGHGSAFILSNLPVHIDQVHAEEDKIVVKGGENCLTISREELTVLMDEKYPTTDHGRLNLPGLLFLQSSPTLQVCSLAKLRGEHHLRIPEGRRTLRYIFHVGIVSIDADQERIKVDFDPGRLPKRADGRGGLEGEREEGTSR